MRYSNRECLQQMIKALQQGILPELPMNSNTQVAAGALMLGLTELLKRETVTPKLLSEIIPQGLQLADQQLNLLESLGSQDLVELKQELAKVSALQPTPENVNGLNNKYEALLALLERSSAGLSAARSLADQSQNQQISTLLKQVADWEFNFYGKNQLPAPESSGSKSSGTTASAPKESESTLTPSAIEAFIRKQLPEKQTIKVENIKRILGGYGKETWFFDLVTESGRELLVIRRNGTGGLIGTGPFAMRQEFALVSVMFQEGVLVPEPLWYGSEDEPGFDRAFYVVRRVRGKPLGTFMASDDDIPDSVWLQAAEQLARIHTIPIQKFNDFFREFYGEEMLNCTVTQGLRQYLDFWINEWKKFTRVPSPLEIYQFDWLYTHMPEDDSPASVVHGDYGGHNMLYEGDQLTAILDWEGALFGSPALDLAYTRKWVTANMDWQKFLDRYQSCGGPVIDQSEYYYGDAYVYSRTSTGTNASSSSIKVNKDADYKDMVLGIQFWPEMMRIAQLGIQGGKQ